MHLEEPDVPPADSLPPQDVETPDTPSDSEGDEEKHGGITNVNTSDATTIGSVIGMMGLGLAGCVGILRKKKRVS